MTRNFKGSSFSNNLSLIKLKKKKKNICFKENKKNSSFSFIIKSIEKKKIKQKEDEILLKKMKKNFYSHRKVSENKKKNLLEMKMKAQKANMKLKLPKSINLTIRKKF